MPLNEITHQKFQNGICFIGSFIFFTVCSDFSLFLVNTRFEFYARNCICVTTTARVHRHRGTPSVCIRSYAMTITWAFFNAIQLSEVIRLNRSVNFRLLCQTTNNQMIEILCVLWFWNWFNRKCRFYLPKAINNQQMTQSNHSSARSLCLFILTLSFNEISNERFSIC